MMPRFRHAFPLLAVSLSAGCTAEPPPVAAPAAPVAVAEPPVVWKRSGDELRWLRSLSNPTAAQWQRREALEETPADRMAADAHEAEARLLGK
jgi:hypothetical protein